MRILKFGGTSVANAGNIKRVIQIVKSSQATDPHLVVVVSALSGITDTLIKSAHLASKQDASYKALLTQIRVSHKEAASTLLRPSQHDARAQLEALFDLLAEKLHGIFLLGELSERSLDDVSSFGERLSSTLIAAAMKQTVKATEWIDARDVIRTDDAFGSANVLFEKTNALLKKRCGVKRVYVMGGFIGSTLDNTTTTLGRGGSDYSASIVGAALDANAIEIWTDVNGVLSADPRIVPEAIELTHVSYEEAGELAHFGAKVIHPKTMRPARFKHIPIDIKNTFHPTGKGTRISDHVPNRSHPIAGVTSLGNISLIRVHSLNDEEVGEVATRIFETLERNHIEILLTTQGSHERALSFAVSKMHAQKAKSALEKTFAHELRDHDLSPITLEENLSIVAVVGANMKGVPGISGTLLQTLGNHKINIVAIAQGSSELNISVVIGSESVTTAVQSIHRAFFTDESTTDVFLLGTGLIGSELLEQLSRTKIPLRLSGIANSRKMLFDKRGLRIDTALKRLDQDGETAHLETFLHRVSTWPNTRRIVVDVTANEHVANTYEHILSNGVALVSANKKGNTVPYARYQSARRAAKTAHVPYVYNTHVGAGLPVIHTMQELARACDPATRIEAVLSGTMSYLFNTFCASGESFSEIVKQAQQKGYTEPDPRDDLNGMDVARKLLILARENGLACELADVVVKPILPASVMRANSIETFYANLKKQDRALETKKQEAKKQHRVLRFVARLAQKKCTVSLESVPLTHPFASLTESENCILITSKNYAKHPIVIRGPGAGVVVTAARVLANMQEAASLL